MPTEPAAAAPAPPEREGAARRQLLAARREHWRRARRLAALLLALWLATGFCTAFFARELAGLSVFGWPLSFYLAAQGAALVYLAILLAYALGMRRFDRQYRSRLQEPL